MRYSAVMMILCLCFATVVRAQRHEPYHVEINLEGGPLGSDFVHARVLPEDANQFTLGFTGIVRVLWHPDHRLALGILTGYKEIVAEQFTATDATGSTHTTGRLISIPFMLDESMRAYHIEVGVALGVELIRSYLEDGTSSTGARRELGTIFHIGSHVPVSDAFAVGGELFLHYMPYRGVVSLAPALDLKYVIAY